MMCNVHERDKEDSFTETYLSSYDMLERFCFRMVNYNRTYQDMVDECIQETFLLLAKDFDVLREHPNIKGWLLTTARNRMLTAIRKAKRREMYHAFSIDAQEYESLDRGQDTIEAWLHVQSIQNILRQISNSLSDNERLIYDLYFLCHKSAKAIACCMGITEGAVKASIVRRGKDSSRNPLMAPYLRMRATYEEKHIKMQKIKQF